MKKRESYEITMTRAHKRALEVISADAYPYTSMSDVIMEMIEGYILRENGRLGKFVRGIYYEDA